MVFWRALTRTAAGAGFGLACSVIALGVTRYGPTDWSGLPTDWLPILIALDLFQSRIALFLIVGGTVSGAIAAHLWPRKESRGEDDEGVLQDILDAGDGKELVINVHGTFASQPGNAGGAWWQQGSEFSRLLEQTGKLHVALPFHWSGRNSEIERRRAARQLRYRIGELESSGVPYHLVGHSHGGNVIWLALKQALPDTGLKHLRSWTTVAAPFLRFGWKEPELDLFLPVLVGATLVWAGARFPAAAFIWRKTLQMKPILETFNGRATLAMLGLVLSGVVFAGLFFLSVRLLLQLGGLELNRWRALGDSLDYGALRSRHLAIWSTSDEAIAGLSGASRIDESDVGVFPPLRHAGSSLVGKVFSPALFPVVAIYNSLVAPLFNFVIRRRMRDSLQGNHFLLSYVQKVGPYPAGRDGERSLGESEELELATIAARGAVATVTAVRGALGVFAMGSPFAVFRERMQLDVSFDGLVHNSYFSSPLILSRIRRHIEGGEVPAENSASPANVGEGIHLLQWRQPVQIRRGIAYSLLFAALYAGSLSIYRTAVEPITIDAKIKAMIKEGDDIADSISGDSARNWYAVRCAAGMCDGSGPLRDWATNQDRDPETLANLGDGGLEGLLESIRWGSACRQEECKRRDFLVDLLDRFFNSPFYTVFELRRPDNDKSKTWFRSEFDRLYLVATRLGGVRQVPGATRGTQGPFTALPEKRFRELLQEQAAKASPRLRGAVLYLLPFFDLQLTEARMTEWDKDLSPQDKLESKLMLVEGMVCHLELSGLPRNNTHFPFQRERPLARIDAEMQMNSLWWGECLQHNRVAATALLAAERNWRLAKSPVLTARFAAVTEMIASEGRSPDLDLLLSRIDAEYRSTIAQALQSRDLQLVINLLRLRLSFDPLVSRIDTEFLRQTEDKILAQIDWKVPPFSELTLLASNARISSDFVEQIVIRAARMAETPYTWDDLMYRLLEKKGHMGFYVKIFHECDSGAREHCRKWDAFVASTSLRYSSKELYGEFASHSDFISERDSLLRTEEAVLNDLSTADGDRKAESKVMADLTAAAVAGQRFHQALEYAHKADIYVERLRAFGEILASWDELKLQKGESELDDLVDQGLSEPYQATQEYIRKNPSH